MSLYQPLLCAWKSRFTWETTACMFRDSPQRLNHAPSASQKVLGGFWFYFLSYFLYKPLSLGRYKTTSRTWMYSTAHSRLTSFIISVIIYLYVYAISDIDVCENLFYRCSEVVNQCISSFKRLPCRPAGQKKNKTIRGNVPHIWVGVPWRRAEDVQYLYHLSNFSKRLVQ